MYIPKTELKKSEIDGTGVFASQRIPKGTIVWKYEPGYDLSFTVDQFETMDTVQKAELQHSAYLSPWSGLWICPPPNDPACFTNHSDRNNISVKFDVNVSSEPYFMANRDIAIGEEITNDYREFDTTTHLQPPEWTR
ncbi:MAG TPA: SET domain-containing protein [Candidatus Saccharimonadales bacterium]|jgi:hypothetical protein